MRVLKGIGMRKINKVDRDRRGDQRAATGPRSTRSLGRGLVVPVVFACVVTTTLPALGYDPPNAPAYGPEGNQYMRLGDGWGLRILVARGGQITVEFPFDENSGRENAVTIYDESGRCLVYRNNYASNRFQPFTMKFPQGGWVYITAWHKNHPPGKGPWYQSPMKKFAFKFTNLPNGRRKNFYFYGFEDMNVNQGNAYNDAKVRVWKFTP